MQDKTRKAGIAVCSLVALTAIAFAAATNAGKKDVSDRKSTRLNSSHTS